MKNIYFKYLVIFTFFFVFFIYFYNANRKYESFQPFYARNKIKKNFYNANSPNPFLINQEQKYNPFPEEESDPPFPLYKLNTTIINPRISIDSNIENSCNLINDEHDNTLYNEHKKHKNLINHYNDYKKNKIKPNHMNVDELYTIKHTNPNLFPDPNHNHKNHSEHYQNFGSRNKILNSVPFQFPNRKPKNNRYLSINTIGIESTSPRSLYQPRSINFNSGNLKQNYDTQIFNL